MVPGGTLLDVGGIKVLVPIIGITSGLQAEGSPLLSHQHRGLETLAIVLSGLAETVAWERSSSALSPELGTKDGLKRWNERKRLVFICLCFLVAWLTQGKAQ